MRFCKFRSLILLVLFFFTFNFYAEEQDNSIFMDFRNQKISDIIYSLAEMCGYSVLIDETVTGNATFRFEDKDFDSALKRFASNCQLFVEKSDDVYLISKVRLEAEKDGKLSLNTENVQIEPLLNILSRKLNKTIIFDSIPSATVTIRVQNVSLEDTLNLIIVKLPGFGLERISEGFYITKSAGNLNKRNVDVFTMSAANGLYYTSIQRASFTNVIDTLFKKAEKEYSIISKLNIQLENITYSDKGFDEILTLILEQASCDFTVRNDIYYIFEVQKKDIVKKFKENRVIGLKNISTDVFISLLPSELNGAGFLKIDKAGNSVILTGSSAEIDPIEEFIKTVDIPITDRKFKTFILENLSAKDAVTLIPKDMLLSDVIILNSGNGFVTQVTEESDTRLSEFLKIIDNKKQSYPVKLKYIKNEELMKALPPSVNKDSITQTTEPTLVFFSGSEKQYIDFSSDLEYIDRPKQQIKYQILVIQRQKTEGVNWGSSFGMNDTTEDSGYSWTGVVSNIFNINFDIISKFGVQFAGSLNAELAQGKSRVLADTTLNGISGESLSFSNTNTYRYRDIIVDTKGELYTSTTREIASGLTLTINGWVSGDNMVTVKVDAQVSKQGSSDSSSSGSTKSGTDTTPPPSTSEKKVSTNVRTKSGEPVIIGGLFQQEEDVVEKKTPGLGSIPALGWLFKRRNVSMADTEFIIYLVPFVEKDKYETLSEEKNLLRLKKKYGEL